MAPRLRLSSRQLPPSPSPILGTGDATFAPTNTLSPSLEIDPSHFGTGTSLLPSTYTLTETSSFTPTSSSSLSNANPSRKNGDGGLGIPVIVGISIGTFAFLALLLVTVMCLFSRRRGRRQKERRWKTLNDSEKGENGNKHISSFMGLRVSLPDPTIPNPFASDSPVLEREAPMNNSNNIFGENPRIFVGSTTNLHTPKFYAADKEARVSPVRLETSMDFASANSSHPAGDIAMQVKAPSPQLNAARHDSAASNYLNLSDDEDEQSKERNPMNLPTMPSPAVLPYSSRPSGVTKLGLPANPRLVGKPPSPIVTFKHPFVATRNEMTFSTNSIPRPAIAALITALDAPPSEDDAPPSSASSYASGFTAIATPRTSMRISLAERPQTITLDPLAENSDLEDDAVTPRLTTNSNAMSMTLEAARPETLTIDPAVKANTPLFVGSVDSVDSAASALGNAPRAPASLVLPPLLKPGWASVSEYGYDGSRGSALTFASSEYEPGRDSLDARRGSEKSNFS